METKDPVDAGNQLVGANDERKIIHGLLYGGPPVLDQDRSSLDNSSGYNQQKTAAKCYQTTLANTKFTNSKQLVAMSRSATSENTIVNKENDNVYM